ncbi:MAG: hypothetical protein REI12_05835, partial [Pedobacter sp.]|nr:hypothetical protein [Pedobacter sp.]
MKTALMRGAQSVCALMLAMIFLLPGMAEARNFSLRYSANVEGDLVLTGNMLLHCTDATTTCTAAKTGSSTTATNRNLTMGPVDTDGDPSTSISSGAYLTIPSGSTVLFAGLYWHGASSNASRNQALFKTPTSFGYSVLTSSTVDTLAGTGTSIPYQAYVDVTSMVAAGGSGTYWVAGVQANSGVNSGTNFPVSGYEAGWSLVVVFSNNSYPLRNFAIYDGFLYTASGAINISVGGFLTPLSGPISTRLGSVVYDGDIDGTGDKLQLNGTDLTDALHTANNAFQGLITDLGVRMPGRNPSYNNTLGYDLARWNIPSGLVANGATNATITVVAPTGTDDYLWPGVLTFATDIYVPIITPNIVKTATDKNGGDLVAGDT